jgi:hypothetical protein
MTKQPLKTWYVTKWWNTQGILKVQGSVIYDGAFVSFRPPGNEVDWYVRLVRLGTEVFASREEAEADVQKKAQRKIASLRKQLAKLEKEYPNV